MISRILSAELPKHIGERVVIAGWLHRRRELKSVTFLVIRDRAGLAQVVLPAAGTASAAQEAALAQAPEETVLQVEGLVVANPQAPGGAELTEPEVMMLSGPAQPPPFDLYRPTVTATLPTILDHAPTTQRHPLLSSGFEIAAASAAGFRAALDAAGFTEIFTPKIVESATEGGANVFRIDYFEFGPPTSPSHLSSTSRPWSACSSGSTRSARSSGLNRTTPAATWRSTPASTPN